MTTNASNASGSYQASQRGSSAGSAKTWSASTVRPLSPSTPTLRITPQGKASKSR